MNSVNIMGRLTKDPEIRLTSNQVQYCNFCIAVDAGKDREAYFFYCTAWKNTAVNIQKYFHKGDKIALTGNLTTRSYEDNSGQKRLITEILVNSFDFCESRHSTDQGQQQAPVVQDEQQPAGELPFEI